MSEKTALAVDSICFLCSVILPDMENEIVRIIEDLETEIIKDKTETRLKELESMGEFKTLTNVIEYCRLHGLDISIIKGSMFQIAGALMDARKDERQKAADQVRSMKIEDITDAGSIADAILNS